MAQFPTSLPLAGSASSSATLAAAGHTALHNNDRDEVRAVATKLGTGSSIATSGQVLRGTGAGTSAWGALSNSDLPLAALLAVIYPVGSIYTNAADFTNPSTLLGFGTWTAFGAGRVLVGIDALQTEFDAAEETGGSKTHTLTSAEMPTHTHIQDSHKHSVNKAATAGGDGSGLAWSSITSSGNVHDLGAVAVNQDTGGGGSHNNLQPYVVVYMWRRTA